MAAQDDFLEFSTGLGSPISNMAAVTPSDATDLDHVSRVLYVGTQGDLAIIMLGGQTVTLTAASGWIPVRVTRVKSSGTTATGIVTGW